VDFIRRDRAPDAWEREHDVPRISRQVLIDRRGIPEDRVDVIPARDRVEGLGWRRPEQCSLTHQRHRYRRREVTICAVGPRLELAAFELLPPELAEVKIERGRISPWPYLRLHDDIEFDRARRSHRSCWRRECQQQVDEASFLVKGRSPRGHDDHIDVTAWPKSTQNG
jgi:hypothetical protein